jgi:hypothetical protein
VHLEELHHIVDRIVLPLGDGGIQVAPVYILRRGLNFVFVCHVALLDDP